MANERRNDSAQPIEPTHTVAEGNAASGNKTHAEQILVAIEQALVTTDEQGQVQWLNPAAQRLLGRGKAQTYGKTLANLLSPLAAVDQNIDVLTAPLLAGDRTCRIQLQSEAGQSDHLILRSSPLLDQQGNRQGLLICLDNLNQYSSQHGQAPNKDALTGLLNRRSLEEKLGKLIIDATTSSRTHAFLMLDMDQFKLINDLSGHHAGDVLLHQIGENLAATVHSGDILGRLGGDEFGVLLSNVESNEAVSVAKRLLAAVQSMQFSWDGRIYPLTASIGIAPINEHTRQAKLVLSQADTALYVAKDTGRNRIHIYTASDEEIARRHNEMDWAERITQALQNNQFRLVYQTIKALQDQEEGDHYEILIRLEEDGKLTSPAAFLPAAERFGLMDKIDRWVVKTYLDYLENNPDKASTLSSASLNLSGTSLADANFFNFLMQQISRPHVQPEKLCFEITETALVTNLNYARQFIDEIHAKGCQFSLDDFGSGMSSFGYLRQLPVDYLKIDGLFVRDMDKDSVHYAMVRAINEISHAMGKKTIAEFVANEQIMAALEAMGIDYAQGYFISEPTLLEP